MDKKTIMTMKKTFDDIMHTTEDGSVEFWYARELMECLGYATWRRFKEVIERAKESCESAGIEVSDHFAGTGKMIDLPKGAKREVDDIMLTRYACYLIAQNGDPRKEEIAFAQSYFAVQTRKQELIEERIAYIERTEARGKLRESEKRLSQNIYERGVDDAGFGRIRSRGDQALFGGKSTQDMKKKLGVSDKRPLSDFLPTLTIAAKNLATEMTNYNVEEKDLQGEGAITTEHVQNNLSVREMLELIEAGTDDIDYVLVFKLSRFGRNAADVLNSLQKMQDFGVNLICVEDGIDSSKDAGKLMISVLSAVAEIERDNILVQTMEGRKQKAREGKWNGGFAPYGYKLVDGSLFIAEDEVEVIKIIFD